MNNDNNVYKEIDEHKEWLQSLVEEVPDNY